MRAVDGGTAAPHLGIVEAGQVVMHEGGAVQKFDRRGGRIRQARVVAAAGCRDRQHEPRADARAAREHGVVHRLREAWRTPAQGRQCERIREGPLDPHHGIHAPPPEPGSGGREPCPICLSCKTVNWY
jgi:hypothetical protein